MSKLIYVSLVVLVAGTLAGCGGDGRKPVFPVTGKLLFRGRPAERALVIFHPVGETGPDVLKPRGEVEADGTFKLTTYGTKDGAPAGDYQVTVEWWLHSGAKGDDSPPANRLAQRYAQPATSGLTARVQSGTNELPAIDLRN